MRITLPKKFFNIALLLFAIYIASTLTTFAQELTPSIAKYYPIDEEVTDGTIISFKEGKYTKSSTEYDNEVIGIVAENPAVSINSEISETSYPVVDSGSAQVKISAANGNIEIGDKITTSLIPGVAMKATADGASIGIARGSFAPTDDKTIGKISVDLQLNYAYTKDNKKNDEEKFLDTNPLTRLFNYYRTSTILKFITASFVVILSFIFGFITFKKIAGKGLEALGRNPLASRVIVFNLALNTIITVMIVTAGILLGYVILRI